MPVPMVPGRDAPTKKDAVEDRYADAGRLKMAVGLEAAKGTAEKLLTLRFPLLIRALIPGALAWAVLYPLMAWIIMRFPAESEWQRPAVFAVLLFVVGVLISTLSGEIYKVYEGRRHWPVRLLRWGEARQKA